MKKYLKVMVVFLLVLVLPLLTIGCGNGQANEKVENSNTPAAKKAEANDVTSQNATSASKEEVKSASSKEEVKSASSKEEVKSASSKEEAKSTSSKEEAKNAEPKVRDPYEAFVVSEKWAIENNATVIERDGKLYSVGGFLPEDTVEKYGFGCYMDHRGSCDMAYIYMADVVSAPNDPFVPDRRDLISLGDFPTFKVKRGESARVYCTSSYLPKQVNLVPTEMLGYTIRAFLRYSSGSNKYLPVLNDTIAGGQISLDNIGGVFDMSENPVTNVRDLTHGQNYKYEYYSGTKYSELVMPADCIAYRYNGKNAKEGTVVPVELTKNGYAEFRFDVEPGIYYMEVMTTQYSVVEVE